MPIADTDLLLYAAEERPENDTDPSGGPRDPLTRGTYTQFTGDAKVTIVSDGADTRNVTIAFRNPAGEFVEEVLALNGASEVSTTDDCHFLLRVSAATPSGARTITVKQGPGGATRGTIPPNETGFTALFIKSEAAAGAVDRYEKLYWMNNHGSLTLNSARVELTADPESRIMIGIETAIDSTGEDQVANRLTVPPGIVFVDDNVEQNVPGGMLPAGEDVGVWAELGLQAGDSAYQSSFTTALRGTTAA